MKQPDIRFSIIIGDIIHNLRSALDHLIWQCVLRDGQEPDRWNQFPICETEDTFLKEVKFRKKHPENSALHGIMIDGDAWTIIEKSQPYHASVSTIGIRFSAVGIIGKFSIWDKHRTLYVHIPFVGNIREAIGWNQQAILLEERIGEKVPSFENETEIIRYRFADQPDPNVHVKGRLAVQPTFGEGPIERGYQMSIGGFNTLITSVTGIVDEVSRLPKVIDV